jgi:hypothetical protein
MIATPLEALRRTEPLRNLEQAKCLELGETARQVGTANVGIGPTAG